MLAAHSYAALEYWFFKVNAGPVALLVDWIARRRTQELVVRASLHSPQQRFVRFDRRPLPAPFELEGLSLQHTSGQVGDLRWDLDLDAGPKWIAPASFPASVLRLTDVAIVSAPLASFTGTIWVGDHAFHVPPSPGLLSHYWGRQLASEWWWVSANQFDQSTVAVECSVFRTAAWGVPVSLPMAYLYLRQGERQRLFLKPPALAQVTGTPEQFEIRVWPPGSEPITLKATGRDFGDLGDGIINTLVGDLDVYQGERLIAHARGTAGLERREPPVRR